MKPDPLLTIEGLTVRYPGAKSPVIRDISLCAYPAMITCVIGESGCGKSTLLHSILQLPGRVEIMKGTVRYQEREISRMSQVEKRRLYGPQMGVVFQEPGASLDPIRKIHSQFYEAMKAHEPMTDKRTAWERARVILENMEFQDPDRILKCCPAQLSGGMNQRVAIALAMLLGPKLLLADEPTSALDVTVQAQIVEELLHLRDTSRTGILLITHNMGVVTRMADRIAVMYGGRIVEYGPKAEVLRAPAHPYTQALLEAVPHLDGRMPRGIPGHKPEVFPDHGCAFAPRCSLASDDCFSEDCRQKQIAEEHWTLCQHKGGASVTEAHDRIIADQKANALQE